MVKRKRGRIKGFSHSFVVRRKIARAMLKNKNAKKRRKR